MGDKPVTKSFIKNRLNIPAYIRISTVKMNALVESVGKLAEGSVKELVDSRMIEFTEAGRKPVNELFKELCFCIMTANCGAKKCWDVQCEVGDGFLSLSEKALERKLRSCGYRYPNRAEYIVASRKWISELETALKSLSGDRLRDRLVANIKGLGMKEASHFLRNLGFKDYAIIDFHIIDLLVKEGVIEKPKTLSKKKYLEIEDILQDISKKIGMSLAELDLYLWYLETGKILK